MPFTPFHLGPAILVGLLLRKHIDFPTFVAASLIVDFRATLVFFGFIDGALHGFLHTFLFGSLLGLGLAAIVCQLKPFTARFMEFLELEPLDGRSGFLLAGILGVWIHILLDSFIYTDIQPFTPLEMNPFLGIFSAPFVTVYGFCMTSLVLGVLYYAYLFWSNQRSNFRKE